MEQIENEIKRILSLSFDINEIDVQVVVAPEGQNADFATNIAMRIAKGTNPREVAEKIKAELLELPDFPFSIEVAGPGFLNFISQDEYWKVKIRDFSQDFAKNISLDDYAGQTVICEFSDPNPFKVLHVGHLYTSIMGDSISRMIEHAGGKVIRANFGGDVGLHVAKTIYAMQSAGMTAADLQVRDNNADEVISSEEIAEKVGVIAENYVKGTRAYEDDAAAKAKITELNKEIYAISRLNVRDAELSQLYWAGRELSYRYFEDFYAKIGVKFDKYYPESTVTERGLSEVKAHTPGVYEESEGAVVFLGERYGLHTRVFINKEGLPTYETKDTGLIFTKFDDYHFDKSIVVTGNEQKAYMEVVLKAVEQYAPELTARTTHITHGMVKLPGNEKMSSRKGNFLRAVDVLAAVSALVPDTKVALAAIKYAMLRYKIGGDFDFDIKESVSTTGNSGVYLQYSAVRAKKILAGNFVVPEETQEGAKEFENVKDSGDFEDSKGFKREQVEFKQEWKLTEAEKNLVRQISRYREILTEALGEFAPHKIANYLYETAQEFSRFYEQVKVNGSEFEAERREIVRGYLNVMEHGLGLLGINVPEEM